MTLHKYCMEEPHGLTWEHGDNRFLKDGEEQAFDVWRKPLTYHSYHQPSVYHMTGTGPIVYNHTAKWAGTGWGSGTRLVKGVFKCFADYLFLIMKEKIAACGPEDDAVFIPTVEVRRMQ
jgi:hypothetical protein